MARVPLMSLGSGVVMTPGGLAIGGAQVLVVTHGTQSQVTVFAAEQGATALAQPLSTNNLGQIPGWVADGQTLDFQVTYAGVTVTQEADPVRGDDTLVQGAPESAIGGLVADLAACEKTANKGIAGGYASLDGTGKVPSSQVAATAPNGGSAWAANTSYAVAQVFYTLAGQRRIVTTAYTSGATYAAADQLNTIALSGSPGRLVTVLNAQQQGVKFRGMTVAQVIAQGNSPPVGSQFNLSTIQQQVNSALALGCNTVRFGLGDGPEIFSGAITLATLLSNAKQILDYCLSVGIYVYVGGIFGTSDYTNLSSAQQQSMLQGICALAHNYPNVIGIDICNEVQGAANTVAPTGTQTTQVQTSAGWVRAVTDLPITFSMLAGSHAAFDSAGGTAWITLLKSVVDYFNIHPYYTFGTNISAADVTANFPTGTAPVMLGEVGQTPGGQTDNTNLGTRLISTRALITQSWCPGAIAFASNDYAGGNKWGFVDASFVERTFVTWPLRTWPKKAAPVVTERHLTAPGGYSTTLAVSATSVPSAQTLLSAASSDATVGDQAMRAVADFTGLTVGDTVTAALVDADSGASLASSTATTTSPGTTADASPSANPIQLVGAITTAASPTVGFGNVIVLPSGAYGRIPLVNQTALQALLSGTQAWTVEARVIRTRSAVQETIIGSFGSEGVTPAGISPWLFYIDNVNRLAGAINNGTTTVFFNSGATTIADTNEHAVAMSYDGTSVRLFIDGTLVKTQVLAGVLSSEATTGWQPILIGVQGGATLTNPLVGSVEDIRLSNVARHTATYTPSASPLTSDANTLGLYSCDAINNNVVTTVKTPWFYAPGPSTAQLQVNNSAARGNLLQAIRQTAYSG